MRSNVKGSTPDSSPPYSDSKCKNSSLIGPDHKHGSHDDAFLTNFYLQRYGVSNSSSHHNPEPSRASQGGESSQPTAGSEASDHKTDPALDKTNRAPICDWDPLFHTKNDRGTGELSFNIQRDSESCNMRHIASRRLNYSIPCNYKAYGICRAVTNSLRTPLTNAYHTENMVDLNSNWHQATRYSNQDRFTSESYSPYQNTRQKCLFASSPVLTLGNSTTRTSNRYEPSTSYKTGYSIAGENRVIYSAPRQWKLSRHSFRKTDTLGTWSETLVPPRPKSCDCRPRLNHLMDVEESISSSRRYRPGVRHVSRYARQDLGSSCFTARKRPSSAHVGTSGRDFRIPVSIKVNAFENDPEVSTAFQHQYPSQIDCSEKAHEFGESPQYLTLPNNFRSSDQTLKTSKRNKVVERTDRADGHFVGSEKAKARSIAGREKPPIQNRGRIKDKCKFSSLKKTKSKLPVRPNAKQNLRLSQNVSQKVSALKHSCIARSAPVVSQKTCPVESTEAYVLSPTKIDPTIPRPRSAIDEVLHDVTYSAYIDARIRGMAEAKRRLCQESTLLAKRYEDVKTRKPAEKKTNTLLFRRPLFTHGDNSVRDQVLNKAQPERLFQRGLDHHPRRFQDESGSNAGRMDSSRAPAKNATSGVKLMGTDTTGQKTDSETKKILEDKDAKSSHKQNQRHIAKKDLHHGQESITPSQISNIQENNLLSIGHKLPDGARETQLGWFFCPSLRNLTTVMPYVSKEFKPQFQLARKWSTARGLYSSLGSCPAWSSSGQHPGQYSTAYQTKPKTKQGSTVDEQLALPSRPRTDLLAGLDLTGQVETSAHGPETLHDSFHQELGVPQVSEYGQSKVSDAHTSTVRGGSRYSPTVKPDSPISNHRYKSYHDAAPSLMDRHERGAVTENRQDIIDLARTDLQICKEASEVASGNDPNDSKPVNMPWASTASFGVAEKRREELKCKERLPTISEEGSVAMWRSPTNAGLTCLKAEVPSRRSTPGGSNDNIFDSKGTCTTKMEAAPVEQILLNTEISQRASHIVPLVATSGRPAKKVSGKLKSFKRDGIQCNTAGCMISGVDEMEKSLSGESVSFQGSGHVKDVAPSLEHGSNTGWSVPSKRVGVGKRSISRTGRTSGGTSVDGHYTKRVSYGTETGKYVVHKVYWSSHGTDVDGLNSRRSSGVSTIAASIDSETLDKAEGTDLDGGWYRRSSRLSALSEGSSVDSEGTKKLKQKGISSTTKSSHIEVGVGAAYLKEKKRAVDNLPQQPQHLEVAAPQRPLTKPCLRHYSMDSSWDSTDVENYQCQKAKNVGKKAASRTARSSQKRTCKGEQKQRTSSLPKSFPSRSSRPSLKRPSRESSGGDRGHDTRQHEDSQRIRTKKIDLYTPIKALLNKLTAESLPNYSGSDISDTSLSDSSSDIMSRCSVASKTHALGKKQSHAPQRGRTQSSPNSSKLKNISKGTPKLVTRSTQMLKSTRIATDKRQETTSRQVEFQEPGGKISENIKDKKQSVLKPTELASESGMDASPSQAETLDEKQNRPIATSVPAYKDTRMDDTKETGTEKKYDEDIKSLQEIVKPKQAPTFHGNGEAPKIKSSKETKRDGTQSKGLDTEEASFVEKPKHAIYACPSEVNIDLTESFRKKRAKRGQDQTLAEARKQRQMACDYAKKVYDGSLVEAVEACLKRHAMRMALKQESLRRFSSHVI